MMNNLKTIIIANKKIKSLKGNSISDDVTKVFSVQSNEEILAHLPPEDWNISIKETWNTKDYYYDGCTQPIGKHHMIFIICQYVVIFNAL
ncbi:hypothetical protein JMF89_06660 [Clostridiaceae bacterium UIB06]|uniref:Uncharacterized protein n=1 Tax=Clostridium thailandense TaxID=2794346 RepID=A0A949TR43_9CLOT|nr:hypothetical protein [Clostridium thailandense]MBV7273852.1 hypothetical protein [Clostridium thailandense]MCH5136884.1 hypothetical protein [Clostridiaceae bacterium UIB06]